MTKRVIIPNELSRKRFLLEEIIDDLAKKEARTPNPDIKHIFHTIDKWEKSGFEKGYTTEMDPSTEIRISKKDIDEVLKASEYSNYDEPLGLLLIGTLLDKALYAHDILSGVPEYKGTAARRIDAFLKTNDSAYITSKANARDYIELLTPSSIEYYLRETGYESVVAYNKSMQTTYITKQGKGK